MLQPIRAGRVSGEPLGAAAIPARPPSRGAAEPPRHPQPVDKCAPRAPFPPVWRDSSAGFANRGVEATRNERNEQTVDSRA